MRFAMFAASLIAWIAMLGAATSAHAQSSKPLTASVKPLSRTPRSASAIPLEWELRWQGKGLLEGKLQYTVSTEKTIGTFDSDDMVLSNGKKRFVTLLPPASTAEPYTMLTIRAKFIGKRVTHELREMTLRIPETWQRLFTVCVVEDSSGVANVGAIGNAFEQALRFEQFDIQRNDRMILTILTHIPPGDLPEGNPHTYCGFDVVVLTPTSLPTLRERQLKVLRQWVDAGGSLVVVPGGVLEPYHAEFLNSVARSSDAKPSFVIDPEGRLLDLPAKREIRLVRKGLGRVALILGPAMIREDFETPVWRRMVWFLWKMQREFLLPILETGKWQSSLREKFGERYDPVTGQLVQTEFQGPRQEFRPDQVVSEPLPSGSWLLEQLLPKSINVVPLSVIGLILAVYLTVVGPVDYFLLGKLKLRKYTWIVFPIVTFLFAGFTVWLSHRYMRADDRRRSIVFLDVGDEGEIVRANRIDLVFNGSHGNHETEVRRGVFTAMNHRAFSEVDIRFGVATTNNDPFRNERTESLVGPPTYSGNVPGRFTVVQSIPQWTPQMNRVLQIAPDEEKPKFNFGSIKHRDFDLPDKLAEHGSNIVAAFGTEATAFYVRNNKFEHFAGQLVDMTTMRRVNPELISFRSGQQFGNSFLRDASIRPFSGVFSLVSQVAPAAGRTFEDLALLDATDPNQTLLLIVIQRGDQMVVYRKLYVDE